MLAVAAVGWGVPGVQNLLTASNSLGKRNPDICTRVTTWWARELCRVASDCCLDRWSPAKEARCRRKHCWWRGGRDSLAEALVSSASGPLGLMAVMSFKWASLSWGICITPTYKAWIKDDSLQNPFWSVWEWQICVIAAVQVGKISVALWANRNGVGVCRRELCRCDRDAEGGKEPV